MSRGELKHWLGLLAAILLAAAVVLATLDGRTFEALAYVVILIAIIATNVLMWRKDRTT
nr:hypothetical protein [Rhodococcus sp. 06-156-3b]